MNYDNNEKTIVALATAPYKSAIHVIRVSGKNAFQIVNKISKKKLIYKSNTIEYGWIIDKTNQKYIDQVLFAKFVSPKSFTGDDLVEISCHGSMFVVNKIIKLLLINGCVLAEPGEFSKRAFLNNKIDVVQARAVNSLVNSTNEFNLKISLDNLRGNGSFLVKKWEREIFQILANVEMLLDYPEYENDFYKDKKIILKLNKIKREIIKVVKYSEVINKMSDGIKIAIIGKPNVGKSTLFNCLINKSDAIVSDIPGTTRDVIRNSLYIDNVLVQISDTAGIRKSNDKIEILGVNKTYEEINNSDLLIFVCANNSFNSADKEIIEKIIESKKPWLYVVNKADLKNTNGIQNNAIFIEAKNNKISPLIRKISNKLKKIISSKNYTSAVFDNFVCTNLKKVIINITSICNKISDKIYLDLLADLLRELHGIFLNLLGEKKDFDLINELFSNFCMGK